MGALINRETRTLDAWRGKLARLPQTIECPEVRLMGRDHEPDVFTGPGRIEIICATEIRFFMHASVLSRLAPCAGNTGSAFLGLPLDGTVGADCDGLRRL